MNAPREQEGRVKKDQGAKAPRTSARKEGKTSCSNQGLRFSQDVFLQLGCGSVNIRSLVYSFQHRTVSVKLDLRRTPKCQAFAWAPMSKVTLVFVNRSSVCVRQVWAQIRMGGRSPPFRSYPGKQKPIGKMATLLGS